MQLLDCLTGPSTMHGIHVSINARESLVYEATYFVFEKRKGCPEILSVFYVSC